MFQLINADCLAALRDLPEASVRCCVTSPPYFGLRDYGMPGQIGTEATPAAFVDRMVEVFREVRRVLTEDGTLWLNLGDSYAGSWGAQSREHAGKHAPNISALSANQAKHAQIRLNGTGSLGRTPGLKAKDLIGIPWKVAFALQADGWWLRSDIIWAKPNCMPESVTDRPTRSHEYIFLLTKSADYFYDHEAIKEPCTESTAVRLAQNGSTRANGGAKTNGPMKAVGTPRNDGSRWNENNGRGFKPRRQGIPNKPQTDMWDDRRRHDQSAGLRNKRDVWTVAPASYSEAHFATYPPDLIKPCIMAGTAPGDTVLDPFAGSGTTGQVALELGRRALLIELNPDYCALVRQRCTTTVGLGI